MVAARPFFMGKPGWERSKAWIWLFSSTDNTSAFCGGFRVKSHHIPQFGDKILVAGKFEGLEAMWLEVVLPPDALHCHARDALGLGHVAGTPMGFAGWTAM